jgi:hypothetical protein
VTASQQRPYPDRNELARACADLHDELDALKQEFADYQERMVAREAALELDAGKTVDEVADRAYDDKDLVLQLVKDRCYEEGEREGLLRARRAIETLITEARDAR